MPSLSSPEPGTRFGRLTAIRFSHKDSGWRKFWLCQCDCGTQGAFALHKLHNGRTRSCGCLKRDETIARNAKRRNGNASTHRHNPHSLFGLWVKMVDRCTLETDLLYPRYGARGIRVCDRWLVFENFLADMGERPTPEHSIDRIDNSKGYEPGNCRWATWTQQARNKTNNRKITAFDETLCLTEWAERIGKNPDSLAYRLNKGMAPEEALTRPFSHGNKF